MLFCQLLQKTCGKLWVIQVRACLHADENCFTVVGMKSFTPHSLAAHACAAFPGFDVVALTNSPGSDESFQRQGVIDSRGDHWIIATPLSEAAGVDLQAQTTLLRFLHRAYEKNLIPFDVPVPVAHTQPNVAVPLFIYKRLSGRVHSEAELSQYPTLPGSMGRALAALHALPAELIERTGLPVYTAVDCRERLRSQLSEGASAWSIPQNLYQRWELALNDDILFNFTTVPTHGNVDLEAFLCVNGVVTGMSGFGAATLGDPAADLAGILSAESEEVAEDFLRAYLQGRKDTDIHLVTRAYLYSEMAILRWLLHGLHLQDANIVSEAKSMLQELADLVGDDPLLPEHADRKQSEINVLEVVEAVVKAGASQGDNVVDPEAITVVLNEVLPLDRVADSN